MKIPNMKIVGEALARMVQHHDAKFYRLRSTVPGTFPDDVIVEVMCPLCSDWVKAELTTSDVKGPAEVPISVQFEMERIHCPQLHVDLVAHVHDHECKASSFIEADEADQLMAGAVFVNETTGATTVMSPKMAELYMRATTDYGDALDVLEQIELEGYLREQGMLE